MARFDFEPLAESLTQHPGLHRSSIGTVYGALDGVPVHVGVGVDDNGAQFLAVAVGTTTEEAGRRVRERWVSSDPDLKSRRVEVQPNTVTAKLPASKAAKSDVALLEERIRDLVSTAGSEPSDTPTPSPRARPALVGDTPMFLNDTEAAEMAQGLAEYHDLRPRMGRAIGFGLAGVLVAALVWGAIAAFLNWSGWLIAIGAGLLIGFLVLLGAGKTNRGIQVVIALLTVVAVFLGEVFGVIIFGLKEFGIFDPAAAVEIYIDFVQTDTGQLLFALGGGLLGAWFGSRLGKPQVDIGIERAPL